MKKCRAIWITWEIQRRSRSLSRALDADLFEFDPQQHGFIRYPYCIWHTVTTLCRERPSLVYAQNPSIFLALLVIMCRPFLSYVAVIDAHNAGIYPLDGRNMLLNFLARYVSRKSDLTIVSNHHLALVIENRGGKAFSLPDPIPDLPNMVPKISLKGAFSVLLICTWADDEPFMEAISAAQFLSDTDIHIYITGKPPKSIRALTIPENITLTGFLREEQYVNLLWSVDLISDLTTREDCLVCGAYEAIAVKCPLILSDTRANRKYFPKGVEYCKNNSRDIANAIKRAQRAHQTLMSEITNFHNSFCLDWHAKRSDLWRVIRTLQCNRIAA